MNLVSALKLSGSVAIVAGLAVGAWVFVFDAHLPRPWGEDTGARASTGDRPVRVRTAPADERDIEDVVGATAVTEASQVVSITHGFRRNPESTALIAERVDVWEGKPVTQGELLVQLDDTLLEQDLAEAEALLAAARARLALARQAESLNDQILDLELQNAESELRFRAEDLDNLEQAYERLGGAAKGPLSAIELAEALSSLAEARFRRSEAESRLLQQRARHPLGPLEAKRTRVEAEEDVERARRRFEIARESLRRAQIVSPIAGIAEAVTIVPGEVLAREQEITKIHQVDPIHVRAEFPLDRAHLVGEAQRVEVMLDNLPGESFAGEIVRIAPAVEEQTRSLPVVIEVPNPEGRIKPGISGFVRLKLSRRATTVPSVAVVQGRSRSMAFVVDEDVARLRPVRTGALGDLDAVEVLAGIQPGEEVVVYGLHRLEDGDRVNPDWQRWAERIR